MWYLQKWNVLNYSVYVGLGVVGYDEIMNQGAAN